MRKHGLMRDLEIRDNHEYQHIGGLVQTPYGVCKVIDLSWSGCYYVIEREDGFRTPMAFRSAERVE